MEVVYIVLIEGYKWKEKVMIALKIESDIYFKIIFLFCLNDTHFKTDKCWFSSIVSTVLVAYEETNEDNKCRFSLVLTLKKFMVW